MVGEVKVIRMAESMGNMEPSRALLHMVCYNICTLETVMWYTVEIVNKT